MNYAYASLGPFLSALALAALLVFSLIGLGLIVWLAALPGRIATKRGHPQADAITVCGWIGLPSVFFWIVALVWAYQRPVQNAASAVDEEVIATLRRQIAGLERCVSTLERQRQESIR